MEEENKNHDALQHRQLIDDNISEMMVEVIERCLGSKAFIGTWISRWESNITDGCLASLRKLKQPYKYIVSCAIMEKNGGELHTAHSCFWDKDMDTSCTVRWENKFMLCVVSIFCLAI